MGSVEDALTKAEAVLADTNSIAEEIDDSERGIA